jgi:hypothetical protein
MGSDVFVLQEHFLLLCMKLCKLFVCQHYFMLLTPTGASGL